MKRLTLLLAILAIAISSAFAQSEDEIEIRRLSQLEVESTVKNDTINLEKLWSPDYVVMNQLNKIVALKDEKAIMRNQKSKQVPFERVIERITFYDNIATEMGHEMSTDTTSGSGSKDVLNQCRFTNIWMRHGGTWQLVARQATNVCP